MMANRHKHDKEINFIIEFLNRSLETVLKGKYMKRISNLFELRGQDLNLRPLGYEPRRADRTALPRYKYKS